MEISQAKKIMGKNFIGPEDLGKISSQMGIVDSLDLGRQIPKINFTEQQLKKNCKNSILILGIPATKSGEKLTINKMRSHFGWDPKKSEPCFYNQDWYLKEKFANKEYLKFQWYLIGKKVVPQTRGQNPQQVEKDLAPNQNFPSAVLTAFAFFAYYFYTKGQMLWKHDFVWCSDKDKNGDRIYVGRYIDNMKINNNGFNIHRHLSIRHCYGAITEVKIN